MGERELAWSDLVAILYRRRRLLVQVFIGGMVAVTLLVFGLGPSYRATATLMVTAERMRSISADAEALPIVDRATDEDLNSQAALLAKPELVRQVLEGFNGTEHEPQGGIASVIVRWPLELADSLYRRVHGLPPLTDFERWVHSTLRRVKVVPIKKTNLIEVSYKARGIEPEWAATFVNALVDQGLAQHERFGRQSEAQQFFDDQRQLLNERVAAAEKARREFYEREGLDSVPEQRALWRTRLAEIEAVLETAETELAVSSARVQTLTAELRRHPKVIAREARLAQNQAVQFIKPRILEKELERSKLLSTYKESSMKVRDVERELAEARQLLEAEEAMVAERTSAANPTYQTLELDLAQAKTELAGFRARVDSLRQQLEAARARLQHLDSVAAEQARLEQEVGLVRDAFATYARKQEQARLSSEMDASRLVNVAVAQPAQVPPGPTHAYRMTLIALGALMSLSAGIGVAFVRDRLDPTLQDGSDAEFLAGAPLLAEIQQ
jgi:succinoglycan biosynthesis transport protein ExoP